jgi:hypothetical protein
MKRKFLIGLAGISLALCVALIGCDTGTGGTGSGGGGDSGGTVVYTSTTAQGQPMVITIWRESSILASAYGAPVYAAYEPKSGDRYTITIGNVLVSSGTVSIYYTTVVFLVGGKSGPENTFTGALDAIGETLTFTGGTSGGTGIIKTNDGESIQVNPATTADPPFVDKPITIPTPSEPSTPSTPSTPYVPVRPVVPSGPTQAEQDAITLAAELEILEPGSTSREGAIVTLTKGITLAEGETVTVPAGVTLVTADKTLTVGNGAALTNNGTIDIGTSGTITITADNEDGEGSTKGTVTNNGTINTATTAEATLRALVGFAGAGKVVLNDTTVVLESGEFNLTQNLTIGVNATLNLGENFITDYTKVTNNGNIITTTTNYARFAGILTMGGKITLNADVDLATMPAKVKAGSTLTIAEGKTLTVNGATITGAAASSKIVVQGSITLAGTSNFYYNDGTTTIGTTIPAGTYTWDTDKWKSAAGAPIVVTNQQVYYYDETALYGGNGTVKIGSLPVGTVTGGQLEFTLPSEVDTTGATPESWTEIGVTSAPEAKVYAWDIEVFTTSGEKLGQLLFTKTVTGGTHYITYVYFDKACTVTATGDFNVSINASAGWNKLYQYGPNSGVGTITTNLTSAPADLKWVFEESPVQVENEQVYNEDESAYAGNGEVKIRDLPVGNVTNGKLSFTLPTTRETNALADALGDNDPIDWGTLVTDGEVVVTPSEANMYGIQIDFITSSPAKRISLRKTDIDDTFHEVQYFYFDKACTIESDGSVSITDNGATFYLTVSIDAHPGWNKVYQYGTTANSTLTTDLTNVPADLKWMIGEPNSSDGDDEPSDSLGG